MIFNKKNLYLALLVFILNIYDAACTVYFVNRGAVEINPLMNYLIQKGTSTFVVTKMFIITLSLFLALNVRDQEGTTRKLFYFFVVIYSLLALYHTYGLVVFNFLNT